MKSFFIASWYSMSLIHLARFLPHTESMLKTIGLLFFLSLSFSGIYSQDSMFVQSAHPVLPVAVIDTLEFDSGRTTILGDPRIERMLQIKMENQKEFPEINGFRIQLFYGSGSKSQSQASEVQSEFLKLYPEMGCYRVFQTPNFKVRVGDFRTKLAATRFLLDLKQDFPEAFIVEDKIKLPEIILERQTETAPLSPKID